MSDQNQTEMFPGFNNTISIKPGLKYQIKRFDDASFSLQLEVSVEEEDLSSVALEKLGYFILPEIPFND